MNTGKKHTPRSLIYAVFLTCVALAACASINVPAPQSTEQSIAYMYPAISVAADETTTLLHAGKIKKVEAQVVLNILEQTRTATNTARDFFRAKDEQRALASLQLARNVLQQALDFNARFR